MSVSVQEFYSKKVYSIEVPRPLLVKELKQLLEDAAAIPSNRQCLVLKGKKLEDDEHFSPKNYETSTQTLIHLIKRDIFLKNDSDEEEEVEEYEEEDEEVDLDGLFEDLF